MEFTPQLTSSKVAVTMKRRPAKHVCNCAKSYCARCVAVTQRIHSQFAHRFVFKRKQAKGAELIAKNWSAKLMDKLMDRLIGSVVNNVALTTQNQLIAWREHRSDRVEQQSI